jgi:hypothetical protein
VIVGREMEMKKVFEKGFRVLMGGGFIFDNIHLLTKLTWEEDYRQRQDYY